MTASLYLWSKTAADNDDADGAINWAENQAPSSVNNSARAMMAAIANYRDDIGGALVSTGSSNEYTITTNQVLAAHANGVFITFRADKTSTAAATTTIDGLAQKSIFRADGTATVSGDIVSGAIYTLRYSSVADGYLASTNALTANLSAISALAVTDSNIIVGNGTTWVAESGATARTSLGLGNVDNTSNATERAATATLTNKDISSSTNTYRAATATATGAVELATVAEYQLGTDSTRAVTPARAWEAAALTALTDGATIAVDFSAGFNFGGTSDAVLALGGNRTLGAPSNLKTGQTGILWFGAATSTRTLTLNAAWVLCDGVEAGPYSITTAQELGVAYWVRGSVVRVTAILRQG